MNAPSVHARPGDGTGRKFCRPLALAGLLAVAGMLAAPPLAAAPASAERATVIVITGAPGESEFMPDLQLQADAWAKASAQAGAQHVSIGLDEAGAVTDYEKVKQALTAEATAGPGELWIVLVGHGTFDGKDAKFNLRGPDVSATEFAAWLKPFQRRLAVINTTSSSAPFLARLSSPGRVVISATRSGNEQNYARFGKYLAEALSDPKSDVDKDGQTSLLECFLTASQRTLEFYKTEGRLATEHALIDDNGDGLGTPADWFRGVLATKRARDGAALDGPRAHQFHLVRSAAEQQLSAELHAKRDQLELQLSTLRERKAKMNEEKFYQELEALLLDLARLYEGT